MIFPSRVQKSSVRLTKCWEMARLLTEGRRASAHSQLLESLKEFGPWKEIAAEGKSSQWLDQVKGVEPRRLEMVDYRQKEATEALSQTNYSTVYSRPSMSSV